MRALSLAVLLAVLATPAVGQTVCGSRAEILAQLETKYNERPDGLACLISAGEGWRILTPAEKGNGT